MPRQKLADVLSFLKTKLATLTDLDRIEYTNSDNKSFAVKRYGARIYNPDEGIFEKTEPYIGKQVRELWTLGLDIVINKAFKSDETGITDAKGVSFWKDTIEALLLNQTNSDVFEDTRWNFLELNPANDRQVLVGKFECELINDYS